MLPSNSCSCLVVSRTYNLNVFLGRLWSLLIPGCFSLLHSEVLMPRSRKVVGEDLCTFGLQDVGFKNHIDGTDVSYGVGVILEVEQQP